MMTQVTFRMKSQPESIAQEVLAGLVERVTFHNGENGFCVPRAKARGHRDLVTVIGHAATISAGEWITATGDWVNDRTHGQQFKARFLRTSVPTSVDGIGRRHIARLENSRTEATVRTLKRIAAATGHRLSSNLILDKAKA